MRLSRTQKEFDLRTLILAALAALSLAACATTPGPIAERDFSLISQGALTPQARLYADCLQQATRLNTYGRAADEDTEMVRFNCTGAPAQAFWTALDAWSLQQDSRWERDGWSYRSTTRVEQNLFGVDFCTSDGEGYHCVIHLNVGEFATPR